MSENATSETPPTARDVIDKMTTITLIQKMTQDDFVAGEITSSELYIEEIADRYGWQNTMRWLNTVYIDNYSNPDMLIGLMHCLSHFEFYNIKPVCQTIALGILRHEDVYVKDSAIRAFENWNDKKALPILKSLSFDADWLHDYVDKLIKALES